MPLNILHCVGAGVHVYICVCLLGGGGGEERCQ